MKVIKIKKLERKKIEKNIFMFLVLFIFFLFTIISYGSQKDLKNQADNFLSASKTITKVKYDKIVVNSLDDIYKERDGLFVFSDINIDLRNLSPVKRKDVFIKLLLPSIEVVQQEVLNNREIVKKLKKNLQKMKNSMQKNFLKNIKQNMESGRN